MPIPLPPQLREGAPQDDVVSAAPAASAGGARPRRASGRRRLTAALVACFGSALLVGGSVNRALDPFAGEVCTGLTAGPDAAPPLGDPGAPAAAVVAYPPVPTSFDSHHRYTGRVLPPDDEAAFHGRRMLSTPRPPEARPRRIAADSRPDPFVPLARD